VMRQETEKCRAARASHEVIVHTRRSN
jgi:hypothetical protein